MLGTERLLSDRERAFEEWPRRRKAALALTLGADAYARHCLEPVPLFPGADAAEIKAEVIHWWTSRGKSAAVKVFAISLLRPAGSTRPSRMRDPQYATALFDLGQGISA